MPPPTAEPGLGHDGSADEQASGPGPEVVAEARAAVDRGEWQTALDALAEFDDGLLCAESLELKALAAYANGEFETAVGAWENVHKLFLASGDDVEAARAAAMIAMYLMMDTGLMAPVRGWLKRAERLLDGQEEAPADALIAMVRTYERFMCGDMSAAGTQAGLAIELGTRLDVQPAVVIGRVASARVKIFGGHIDEGLGLLDEVGALLMSGEVDLLTTGMMYCELICAAQGLAMHDMANEWTDVMERWRHDGAFGGINGRCRVHRAEMLRMSGPCDAAEEEALRACDELRPWMRREFGWPLTELGNIRLRRGDLDGAEEAFIAAHEHAWSPQPGLALLRLAQGDLESAAGLIGDAIAHPFNTPSKERPPFGDLRLAPLFDAQVEIAVAVGDLDTAKTATDALEAIAQAYPSPSLGACAALARSRTSLLEGDLEAAVEKATMAVEAWTDSGAPYETSMARMVLADALRRSGNERAAHMELRAAMSALEAFGALPLAERAASLVDEAEPAAEPKPTGQTAIFSCSQDVRQFSFAGESGSLRDLKGFRYLERMLGDPNREFHVLDLVAVEQGMLPVGQPAGPGSDSVPNTGDGALPVLDEKAREAYQRRLAEVEEDIDEATEMNDIGRLELAQRDRDYLMAELKSAVGLGGRNRMVGGSSERARTAVARSLRYGLKRLAEHHPTLAAHLEQSVHTGTYCSYAPDPLTRIDWQI